MKYLCECVFDLTEYLSNHTKDNNAVIATLSKLAFYLCLPLLIGACIYIHESSW